MFWTKVKIAAGIIAAATVVAGAGTPLAVRAAAGGKDKGPKIGSASKVIRARVTAVRPSPVDGPATVTIDKGSAGGVRKGFVFDITRDGKRVNGLKIEAVAEKQASGKALEASAWQSAKIVKVGDVAVSRLTVVNPGKKTGPPTPAPVPASPGAVYVKMLYGADAVSKVPKPVEEWIVKETARLGSLTAANNTDWIELAGARQQIYASRMGGRLVEG